MVSTERLLPAVQHILDNFEEARLEAPRQHVFAFDWRAITSYQYGLRMRRSDSIWAEMLSRLSGRTRVYDNGMVQLYVP